MGNKKKNKEVISDIYFPMFGGHSVTIVVSLDMATSNDKRSKILGHATGLGSYSGLFSTDGSHNSFIFLMPTADADIIAHECFHAICHIKRQIGTKLSDKSEESFAYPLGYLVGLTTDVVKQSKKHFKTKKSDTNTKSRK